MCFLFLNLKKHVKFWLFIIKTTDLISLTNSKSSKSEASIVVTYRYPQHQTHNISCRVKHNSLLCRLVHNNDAVGGANLTIVYLQYVSTAMYGVKLFYKHALAKVRYKIS